MKKNKLNIKRLILLLIFVACVTSMIADCITLGLGATFTWFGVFTFLLKALITSEIYEYFEEIIKKNNK